MIQYKHIYNKILKCISRAYPQNKTICIDKRVGKYYCTSRKFSKTGPGRQVWFLPKTAADLGVSPREILQFLATFKACIRYFLSIFFHPMIALQKLRKMFFISSKKSSFPSWDIQIFVIFSLPFHTLQIQKDQWKWNEVE